jgi:hypothetical protein
VPAKDRDAEALINQSVRAVPDAPYMLVQSVLVQEQALQAANERVLELEERMRALESGVPAREQSSSGSFLGGLFGGGRPATQGERASSVPQVGSRATPLGSPPQPQASPAWGQQGQPAPASGGGFMRSAMATAAGVAGGMLLAESVRNMLGGGNAHASPAGSTAQQGAAGGDSNAGYSDKEGTVDESANDPGLDDGGDFGGGELDI